MSDLYAFWICFFGVSVLDLQSKKIKKGAKMLTEKTLNKIVYEYQHGGVQNYHPEISLSERKALLKYLFSLPSKCAPECEATHKNS